MKTDTIKDLKEIMAELEQDARKTRAQIQKLEAEFQTTLAKIRDLHSVINMHRAGAEEKQRAFTIKKDSKFRDVIRDAMKDVKEPIRPKDLTERLEAAGFIHSGKSDLGTRVGVELHKLFKTGELVRMDGKYLPAKH